MSNILDNNLILKIPNKKYIDKKLNDIITKIENENIKIYKKIVMLELKINKFIDKNNLYTKINNNNNNLITYMNSNSDICNDNFCDNDNDLILNNNLPNLCKKKPLLDIKKKKNYNINFDDISSTSE